ncbi:MAG: hypothetical protein OEV43_01305 [Coriobacteriia bacterium]|nr:hypothetical protein [Coriobacteriia bacterium]
MSGRTLCGALVILGVIFLAGAVFVSPVFAYVEPNTLTGTGCSYCHPWVWVDPPGMMVIQRRPTAGGDCMSCHADYVRDEWVGPHGNYSATSAKCSVCHTVHDAPEEGILLLPRSTISGTCMTCHDGTGGNGVYGTVLAQTGVPPGGGHRCEETTLVPGGDADTGGVSIGNFGGQDGTLTCSDCHSPHGADMVEPFKGDRRRVRGENPAPVTSRLLRRRPGDVATPVGRYGSDWCLACHAGRSSEGVVHNHPVEQKTGSNPDPYHYGNVPILDSDTMTGSTVLAAMGGVPYPGGGHWVPEPNNAGNRGYLMPYPRTAEQSGHSPICQQCHEDTRAVGMLSADGTQGDAATATITAADGVMWSAGWVPAPDNPMFQNFPHETENRWMLVEEDDDLCMNCHPPAALP